MNARSHGQSLLFTLIAGEGLGLSYISNQLTDVFSDHPMNAGQTRLAINSANGNSIIRDKVFSIHDAGVMESIGLVWNSHDKQFRIAALPVVKENTAYIPFLWNPSYTLTEPDGTLITYSLNKDGLFTADKIGVQGLSHIKKIKEGFERYFPGNGLKETYNQSGKLIRKTFPPNNTISYHYEKESDVTITLPSGRKITYETDCEDSNIHHLSLDTLKLVSYESSVDKQTLRTAIYQPDGSTYNTTYKQTASGLTIISDDTTTQTFLFNQQGEIENCTIGSEVDQQQSWQFALDKTSHCMEVSQDKKVIAKVTTDKNHYLETVKLQGNQQSFYYHFSDRGQLLESGLCDENKQIKEKINTLAYDPVNGLPQTIQQHQFISNNSLRTTYTYYSGENENLRGIKLSEHFIQNGQTHSAWYVYNDKRQLCYFITPAGWVTKYIYETASPYKLLQKKQVTTKCFDAKATQPSLQDLKTWWDNTLTLEDKQKLQITQFGYDQFGRENEKTIFTAADDHGSGLFNDDTFHVKSVLDAMGHEIKTEIETDRVQNILSSSLISTKDYDSLGRITRMVNGAQAGSKIKQEHKISYIANQIIDEYPNGLKSLVTNDTTGQMKLNDRVDTVNDHSRALKVDKLNPHLKQLKREDGMLEYHYYDYLNRPQYQILPNRVLLQYKYDDLNRLTHENTYILPEGFSFDSKISIEDLLKNSFLNLKQVHLYDNQGQLAYDIVIKSHCNHEGEEKRVGYLTEHYYQFGKKVQTTAFAQPIDEELLNDLSWQTMKSALLIPDNNDRVTQYFYDADGMVIGLQEASNTVRSEDKTFVQGYLQEYEVDGIGNRYHEIRYTNPSFLSQDLNQARPHSKEALHTWYWFDGAGRKIATLDADCYLTLFDYFPDGKLKRETKLYQPQVLNTSSRLLSLTELKRDETNDAVIEYAYDDLRRVNRITNHLSQLEIHVEYDANDNESKRILKDLKHPGHAPRIVQKGYNAFNELQCESSERISARVGDDKNKWTHYVRHPETGLKLRTKDVKGNQTLYFYDEARRIRVEITPNGAVREYEYQPDGIKPEKIHAYYQPMTPEQLAKLVEDPSNNGFITETILQTLPKKDAKDHYVICKYDAEGDLTNSIDENGSEHFYHYDAFHQIKSENHLIDKDQWLQIDHKYDLRGNCIETVSDPAGLEVVTKAEYNDPLGRKTSETDELGHELKINFHGLRKQTISDTETSGKKCIERDAFLRKLNETDWTGTTIKHAYDDKERSHTVTNPLGTKVSDYKNAFGEIETIISGERTVKIQYGVDGQVEKMVQPDQSEESKQYDELGLQQLTISEDHHVEKNEYNTSRQLVRKHEGKLVDGEMHLKHLTQYTPNVFSENETIVSANGVVSHAEKDQNNQTLTLTTNPEKLHLITQEKYNYQQGLTKITQTGKTSDAVSYIEKITRDVLNRERARYVDMGDHKSLLLQSKSYDKKGNITRVEQADGSSSYQIFDVCSNLRITIDREGFAVFKDYDLNHHEICRTYYQQRLTESQIQDLQEGKTVSEMKAVVASLNAVQIQQNILDANANVRFSITWCDNGEGHLIASVIEYRYNTHGEKIACIEYANTIPEDEVFHFSHVASLDQWIKKTGQENYRNKSHDRLTHYVRNQQGKIVFERDGEGYIVEKRYDVKGRIIASIAYADNYKDIDLEDPVAIHAKLNLAHQGNRASYFVYDHFGNLRYELDGETYLSAFTYNNDNQECQRKGYAKQLKDALGDASWKTFEHDLGKDGCARDADALIAFLEKTENQLQDKQHDLVTTRLYDDAGRKKGEVDSVGFSQIYVLNVLGLLEKKIDKLGYEWIYHYDRAKRIIKETSPAVDLTTVKMDRETGQLQIHETSHQTVDTVYLHDDNANNSTVVFADNFEVDKRSIKTIYNKNKQIIGTLIKDVFVDDGSAARPMEGKRQEIKTNLTTSIVHDYAGREIVHIDEEGVATFTLYDGRGRKRYQIDGDGYVTEFRYEHAFTNPTHIMHYAEKLATSLLQPYLQIGLSLHVFAPLFAQIKEKDKRTVTMKYDRCGLKLCAKQDAIITAAIHTEHDVKSEIVQPTHTWSYNAFGEPVEEKVLLASEKWAVTKNDYDHNGNINLSISPNGDVIEQQFGMRDINKENAKPVCLSKVEYAIAIPLTENETMDEIRKNLPRVDDKTRRYSYEYDNRLLKIGEKITSGDQFYETIKNYKTGEINRYPVGKSIHYGTLYDAEKREIAYESPRGKKRYLKRDARGSVIAETDFPLQTTLNPTDPDSLSPMILLVKHGVNAHQQVVSTKKFHRSATLTQNKQDEIVIQEPAPRVEDKLKDQQSYVVIDNVGNAVAVQSLKGQFHHVTYNRRKQPVRSYQFVTGYHLKLEKNADASISKRRERIKRLRGRRCAYDKRSHIVMEEKFDAFRQMQTYRHFNAFGECEAEGPSKDIMRVQRRFDKSGYKWFTNEENGIATISFPDGSGNETAIYRSPDIDLNIYQDDQHKAKEACLDKPYDETFYHLQRSLLVRDLKGNIVKQQTPWYRKKSQYTPQNIAISFSVLPINNRMCVVWKQPEQFMLSDTHTILRFRCKGESEWKERQIQKQSDGKYYVDVHDLPADCYQYELNFYFRDPQQIDGIPSFQASGEVMLDTNNYTESINLVWYMRDETSLVLCGKTGEVSSIELWQNNRAIKRLPATRNPQGQFIVNLSEEISADYDFKLVYGSGTVSEILPGKLCVRTLKPGQQLTAREVNLTGMHIGRYQYWLHYKCHHHRPPPTCINTQYRYEWNCNYPLNSIWFRQNGLENNVLPLNQLPPNKIGQVYLNGNFPSAGPITGNIHAANGGEIRIFSETPPIETVPIGQVIWRHQYPKHDKHWDYDELTKIDETRYDDVFVLHFTPLPPGIQYIRFQYAITNSKGETEWLPIPDVTATNNGMSVPLHSVQPGLYRYRFYATGSATDTNINHKINLDSICGLSDQDGWYTGTMTVRKGQLNHQVFVSEAKPDQFDIIRPTSLAQYDAWRNRTSETDRKGKETRHAFNLFDQEIKMITPETTSFDQHGVKSKGQLTTERFRNLDGNTISVKSSNEGEDRRVVNARGNTLYQTDADFQATVCTGKPVGTAQYHKSDALGHHLETINVGGGKIISDFVSENGLTTETRIHPGGICEQFESNEMNELIRHENRARHETCYDHDGDGHEIFNIDQKNHTEVRIYDIRTGEQTAHRDKDGYLQTWELDDYFGNAISYSDIAGQTIKYEHNHNKQVVTEIGNLSKTVLSSDEEDGMDTDIGDPEQIRERTRKLPRGSTTDTPQPTPPLPKDIKNNYDEAGHLIECFDHSEQLRTIKSYDENDYCDRYYFVNKDGRVYQCVNIDRDELNRISRLQDTKIVIEIGYDKNSNRRFAKAHMIGDDPTMDNAIRESWYDYTVSNRVILRDCIMQKDGNMALTKDQGMQLDYQMNRIKTQTTHNQANNLEVKTLGYHEATSLLKDIETREKIGGFEHLLSSRVKREFDDAERCTKVTQTKIDFKEKKIIETEDTNIYDPASNDIKQQLHSEVKGEFASNPKDMDYSWNTRTIEKASNTGRPLHETNKFTGQLKDEDYTQFHVNDEAHHRYFAADDGLREKEVSVHRDIPEKDRIKHDKNIPVAATLTTTQDANGHYTSVRGPKIPGSQGDAFRSFVTNSEGCIVFKQTQNGKNYYIYAEKQPGKMVLMAYFGDLVDKDNDISAIPYKPKVINLNTNHQALSKQYPPPVPMEYTVTRRMSYQQLAEELNYTGYASQIAEANNKYEEDYIEAGERIIIPPLYFEIPETAWNGKIPSVDSIIDSLYPTLPSPRIWLEPKKINRNWLETFLEVAAFSLIMAYMPGFIFSNPTFLQAFLSYAISGAVGNTVDQVIATGFGSQTDFNIKSVFTAALTSGITGGILQANGMLAKNTSFTQDFSAPNFGKSILVAEEVTAAQHAALLVTGLERKFDWRVLGTSAFNAAAGYTINKVVSNNDFPVLNAGLNTGIDGVGDSLIMNQKIDINQLSATVSGTMVGNYAGHSLSEAYKNRNVAEKKAEKTTKHKATQATSRAEAHGRNQHRFFSGKKQQTTNDGFNNERLPTNALDDWNLEVNSLSVSEVPPFDINDTGVTSTTPANDESWGMRQLYKLNDALEPYAYALDTFNSYAEPISKGIFLAASGYGLATAFPAAIPTLLRVATPFGYTSMETMGIPTVTITNLEAAAAGTGVFLGSAAKYGRTLLSKLSLFGTESVGAESVATRQRVLGNIAESRAGRTDKNVNNFALFSRRSTAIEFYSRSGFQAEDTLAHMRGIDFSQPVEIVNLEKGIPVVQYMLPNRPVGNYFAPLGTSGNQLGIYTSGRIPTTFFATQNTNVLQSRASAMVDDYSMAEYGWKIETEGSGTQYFSPSKSVWERK